MSEIIMLTIIMLLASTLYLLVNLIVSGSDDD
jgi:hypothetical protein